MWWVMFVAFLIGAVLFLVLGIKLERHEFWNITFTLLAWLMFLILAFTVLEIEFPYQYYDPATGTVLSGSNTWNSEIAPWLTYFFFLCAFLTFIYWFAMIWDTWYNYKNWHGGGY